MPEEVQLIGKTFLTDEYLDAPASLTVTENGLIIVNLSTTDTLANFFSDKGELLSKFLLKGQGPEEFTSLYYLQYDGVNKVFYGADPEKSVLYRISLNDINNPEIKEVATVGKVETDNAIDVNEVENALYYHMGQMDTGEILAANATTSGMAALYDSDGKFKQGLIPYPDKSKIDENLTDWANINLYYPTLRISPDGKKAAMTYSRADIRLFFQETPDSLEYKIYEDAYPNDIHIEQTGPDFVQGFGTKDTKTYSLDLSLSNKYAYQLYYGLSSAEARETEFLKDTGKYGSDIVKVYDLDGKLVKTLKLDKCVEAIGISPDDKTLYAITESSDSGYTILKYEL